MEKDNEMRIANWNVHALYRVGAMIELVKEMGKYKIDISTRNCGQGNEL